MAKKKKHKGPKKKASALLAKPARRGLVHVSAYDRRYPKV